MPAAHADTEAAHPNPLDADGITVTDPEVTKRAVSAAAIGNITEWFDFGVFANLTPVLTAVFFTGASETVGTIGHRHHDGRRHLRHRLHPRLRDLGSGRSPADAARPPRPGLLHRRRVRRGDDLHRRVRARQEARLPRQPAGVRHPDRLPARRGGRPGHPAARRDVPRGPALLGLAHPVPDLRADRRHRALPPPEAGGHPRVPGRRRGDQGPRGQPDLEGDPQDLRQVLATDADLHGSGAGLQRDGTVPSALPALFPTEVRYGGLSIAFNISVSLFGGTTAFFNALLVQGTGDSNVPGYYLMAAGAIGAVACYCAAESAGRPLPGSAPAAESREEAREMALAGSGTR